MANASYTSFRSGVLTDAFDLNNAVTKVALVSGYTYNAAHLVLSDITGNGGAINGTATLTNPNVSGGTFDADDVTITTTASANPHVLIVYQASAITGGADLPASQQLLMFHFDTGTGLPVTPGTGTLAVTWPNTAGKIYKIG